MAFHTRKIKIKALNDSKEITAIIYINSITLIVLAITEISLHRYVDVYHAVVGLALLVEATMFTGIVFIPKVFCQWVINYYYYYYDFLNPLIWESIHVIVLIIGFLNDAAVKQANHNAVWMLNCLSQFYRWSICILIHTVKKYSHLQ